MIAPKAAALWKREPCPAAFEAAYVAWRFFRAGKGATHSPRDLACEIDSKARLSEVIRILEEVCRARDFNDYLEKCMRARALLDSMKEQP